MNGDDDRREEDEEVLFEEGDIECHEVDLREGEEKAEVIEDGDDDLAFEFVDKESEKKEERK